MNPQKDKGDRGEREIAAIVSDLLGLDIRRKLGAGRAEDTGDLHGLDDWTVEVKNWTDVLAAINEGLKDLTREQANAGTPFGVCFVRRRGGRWIAVMDVEQWAAVYRETTA